MHRLGFDECSKLGYPTNSEFILTYNLQGKYIRAIISIPAPVNDGILAVCLSKNQIKSKHGIVKCLISI